MKVRFKSVAILGLLGVGSFAAVAVAQAIYGQYSSTAPVVADGGSSILQMDVGGNTKTTPTAPVLTTHPNYVAGTRAPLSVDVSGGLRVSVQGRVNNEGEGPISALQGFATEPFLIDTGHFTLETTSIQAVAQGNIATGTNFVIARTPKVFKPLAAVAVGSEVTIWTPAAGTKFRLMGFCISQGTAAGNIALKDNTAGTTVFIIPKNTADAAFCHSFGNGILSAAVNNVLTATGIATETLSGTVYGTEE